MSPRRIIIPVIALAIAGATAFYARSWMESQRSGFEVTAAPAPGQVTRTEVLVADADLSAGTFIVPGHLRWQIWPTDELPESYLVRGEDDEAELVGAVVRRGMGAGEPITDALVVKPGDRGFLAAVLEPGMRAISVPINDASSNAGLIFPGDRVDLILTQTLAALEGDKATETRRVSETVLDDVRVIAMGKRVDDDPESEVPNAQAKTATLEVSPVQAEMVALVTELGKLSLSLRSLASESTGEAIVMDAARRFTWDSDVARVLRPENRPSSSTLVIMHGKESETVVVRDGGSR